MPRVALFIDGSNFFYMQTRDLGYFLDPKKLLQFVTQFGEVTDAYYYTGEDDLQDARQQGYLDALVHMGYSLVTKRIKTIVDSQTGTHPPQGEPGYRNRTGYVQHHRQLRYGRAGERRRRF